MSKCVPFCCTWQPVIKTCKLKSAANMPVIKCLDTQLQIWDTGLVGLYYVNRCLFWILGIFVFLLFSLLIYWSIHPEVIPIPWNELTPNNRESCQSLPPVHFAFNLFMSLYSDLVKMTLLLCHIITNSLLTWFLQISTGFIILWIPHWSELMVEMVSPVINQSWNQIQILC